MAVVCLSIVIPALGTQEQLDETLVSVLENRPPACEVIVVHPRTYVDPYDLSDEVHFLPSEHQDLIPLLATGVSASQGKIVHLLQSGGCVEPAWTDGPRDAFTGDSRVAAVSPALIARGDCPEFQVIGVSFGPILGRRLCQRRTSTRWRPTWPSRAIAPTLRAGFYRASALAAVGGLRSEFGPFADVDLGLRLRSAGWRCVCHPASRVHMKLEELRADALGCGSSPDRRLYGRLAGTAAIPCATL
jgi:hypothetical protein